MIFLQPFKNIKIIFRLKAIQKCMASHGLPTPGLNTLAVSDKLFQTNLTVRRTGDNGQHLKCDAELEKQNNSIDTMVTAPAM